MPRAKLTKTSAPGIYRAGTRYVAIVRVRGKQQKLFAPSLKQARDMRAELLADVSRGEYRSSSRDTFGEYAREWVDTYGGRTTRGFRESTRIGYRRSIEKAIPFFDDRCRRMAEIEPADIRAYIRWLFDEKAQGRRLSLSTVRNHVAALRALFATAAEDGDLRHNPAYGVRISRPGPALEHDEEKIRALERDELARLLSEIPDAWRLFFDLLAATGVRIGEAVELRWQDVVFGERPQVAIRRRFYRGDVDSPKSKYGRRDLPLPTAVARRLWAVQDAPDELLFSDPQEGWVNQDKLRRNVLKPAAIAAGVEWATLHTFRHTCASLLFAEGRNVKQVQEWLGHHDPAFTLKRYVHLLDEGIGGPLDLGPITTAGATPGATHHTETGRNRDLPRAANL